MDARARARRLVNELGIPLEGRWGYQYNVHDRSQYVAVWIDEHSILGTIESALNAAYKLGRKRSRSASPRKGARRVGAKAKQ